MLLLDTGSSMETVQLVAVIISGIVIPVLGFALAIAVRHGWVNKKTADTLKEDLENVKDIAGAATKAIEGQKTKNPEVAKNLTTDVVSEVKDKGKLDDFLKELDLNK